MKFLEARHPLHAEMAEFWSDIETLAAGGRAIRARAERFLAARPMEPSAVYQARLARFSYQGILDTALGWYISRLFADVDVDFAGDERLESFRGDCDRRGTSLVDTARGWFERLLLDGCVYVLLDLPGTVKAPTLRAQREAGALDPFLVTYPACQVVNWQEARDGDGFEWILIATTTTEAEALEADRVEVDRWYYFDRTEYRTFEARRKQGEKGKTEPTQIADGRHAMAELGRVPVRRFDVPRSLWLGDRVYPQVLDHLNADNALGWALLQANLAVPVIAGDYEEPPKLSETAYIKLDKGASFTWSEPAGTSFAHASTRIRELREEIYRQMYLQAQARSNEATPAAQSGISKEMDMAPSVDVLNGYGAIMRAALLAVIGDVLAIDKREVKVTINGLEFDAGEPLDEIAEAQGALDLDIPSDTFRREVQKRAVRCLLPRLPEETQSTIEAEIDAAPGQAEQAAARRAEMALAFRQPPQPDNPEEGE